MKALYDSAWHHPLMAYVGVVVLAVALARRLPFLYGYLVVFGLVIAADATITGAWTPLPTMPAEFATALPIVFVILGDFRYFFFAERVTRPHEPALRIAMRTFGWSLVVPVATGLSTKFVPAMQESRVLFLVYECALFAAALALQRWRFGRQSVDAETATWVRGVSTLFAALYAGWALSDVVILAGANAGHLLRVVPNTMYYAVLLPFILFTAPASHAPRIGVR